MIRPVSHGKAVGHVLKRQKLSVERQSSKQTYQINLRLMNLTVLLLVIIVKMTITLISITVPYLSEIPLNWLISTDQSNTWAIEEEQFYFGFIRCDTLLLFHFSRIFILFESLLEIMPFAVSEEITTNLSAIVTEIKIFFFGNSFHHKILWLLSWKLCNQIIMNNIMSSFTSVD